MKYHEALKIWNAEQKTKGATKYVMPKKDSDEYKAVQKLREVAAVPAVAPGNVVAPGPLDKHRGKSKE